ncbi:MAG: phosphoribosylanthranilate isomerase [Candidatus Omnitrophica bacterium]|nr:phosphoribosylanthranilate isomerase [Candidatus Omnitrophota bacterium]
MVRVKICGITNLEDAQTALDAGADAIGFVFAPSARRVTPREAGRIARAVGPWISTVGVFVDEKIETLRKIAEACRLSAVQLHGNENKDYLKAPASFKIIKAFRVADRRDFKGVANFPADAFLFDTKIKDRRGGTGVRFDWKLLKGKKWARPAVISGGLTPENVGTVVRLLAPYGVDVSSGVEGSPGKKDGRLVRAFIKNAKNA